MLQLRNLISLYIAMYRRYQSVKTLYMSKAKTLLSKDSIPLFLCLYHST